jgi:CRP/FNR family cyclic AMP-dependent transcriptional regulator
MIDALMTRRRLDPKIERMRRVPLFAGCSLRELEAIAPMVDEVEIGPGRVLMRRGEIPHEFLVLREGEAEVRCASGARRSLRAGDFVGELALLAGGPRTATVVTTTQAHLLVLTDRAFARLVECVPQLSLELLRTVAARVPLEVAAPAPLAA